MSEALRPRQLKVLFSKKGAPKWVIESGAGGENDGMHVVVRRGDQVEWRRKGIEKFKIRFVTPSTETPFENWAEQVKESSGGNPNFVEGTIREPADLNFVVYKYNVEVDGDHDPLDPAIIMDE
jgi:hypothetical protein